MVVVRILHYEVFSDELCDIFVGKVQFCAMAEVIVLVLFST
jgi:hypothetical protein